MERLNDSTLDKELGYPVPIKNNRDWMPKGKRNENKARYQGKWVKFNVLWYTGLERLAAVMVSFAFKFNESMKGYLKICTEKSLTRTVYLGRLVIATETKPLVFITDPFFFRKPNTEIHIETQSRWDIVSSREFLYVLYFNDTRFIPHPPRHMQKNCCRY